MVCSWNQRQKMHKNPYVYVRSLSHVSPLPKENRLTPCSVRSLPLWGLSSQRRWCSRPGSSPARRPLCLARTATRCQTFAASCPLELRHQNRLLPLLLLPGAGSLHRAGGYLYPKLPSHSQNPGLGYPASSEEHHAEKRPQIRSSKPRSSCPAASASSSPEVGNLSWLNYPPANKRQGYQLRFGKSKTNQHVQKLTGSIPLRKILSSEKPLKLALIHEFCASENQAGPSFSSQILGNILLSLVLGHSSRMKMLTQISIHNAPTPNCRYVVFHGNNTKLSNRCLCSHIHSRSIHNSQKTKANQVSIDRRVNKLWGRIHMCLYMYTDTHAQTGILFTLENKGNCDTCYNMDTP